MNEVVEKNYQIYYKNKYMTTEFYTSVSCDEERADIIAQNIRIKFDQVRIIEEIIIKRTIKVYT